jgi:transcriptional regulator with XRE-family HTH domain
MQAEDLREPVGWALWHIRDQAELSQTQVAQRMGIAQRTYANLEAGTQRIYLDQVLAAEDACGQPAGTVLRIAGLIADGTGVEGAIRTDVALSPDQREMMLAAYRAVVPPGPRRGGR